MQKQPASINLMNQKHPPIIYLTDSMRPNSAEGLRREYGIEVHDKLISEIEKNSEADVLYLSMKGIDVVDASFSREAIVRTIKEYRGKIGFCLIDIDNEEYIDNFVAAIIKLQQPVFFKLNRRYKVIGPSYPHGLSKGNQEVIDYVNSRKVVTATMLKSDLNLTITNASTKLKQLLEQGYLMRKQEIAASGGVEYLYYPIR